MLLSRHVMIKIGANNAKYWRSKGYDFPAVGGKCGMNGIHRIKVKVDDLQKESNRNVACRCNSCGKKYVQRWSRNKDECVHCVVSRRMKGNKLGHATKGRTVPNMWGPLHPRWNPNKKALYVYAGVVRRISEQTYRDNVHLINPENHPRTKCGVEGGYQLDHIVPIVQGFEEGLSPEFMGGLENLQMLPWKKNLVKNARRFHGFIPEDARTVARPA